MSRIIVTDNPKEG